MSPIKSTLPGQQVREKLDHTSPFTTIVVDSGNTILEPAIPRCPQSGAILWLVYNNDIDPHTVGIDPASFETTDTPPIKMNPLLGGKISVNVASKELAYLAAAIRPDAQIRRYKYTITSDKKLRDPELDVVDP